MGLSIDLGCSQSGNGKHCTCNDALAVQVCCYCGASLRPERLDPQFEDDGSEENTDA